jgi:hypothetical protein
MGTLDIRIEPLAVDVSFSPDAVHVVLADGREVSAPLEWFPRLRAATTEHKRNWRLIGKGIGIHWEDVDEDISVESLLAGGTLGPLLMHIAGPSEETISVGEAKGATAMWQELLPKFWQRLLDKANELGVSTHAGQVPRKEQALTASTGKAGLSFIYVVRRRNNPSVELYIDTRDRERNKGIFDIFFAKKDQIGGAFRGPLSWERLEYKRAARIKALIKAEPFSEDESSWPPIQGAMIDGMSKLSKALMPHIQTLVL